MHIGTVTGSTPPPLQTSWTRAERACAAHHHGDTYYDLLADSSPNPTSSAGSAIESDPTATTGLQPGFTLHL